MTVKLFILGLPGSGKSTTSRHIVDYVKYQHKVQSAQSINDYEILFEMFEADTDHKRFKPTEEHNGFDVIDLAVCDIALKKIEVKTIDIIYNEKSPKLIVIEFARNNYDQAFKQFSYDFLRDAYFLFLDANIHTCKQRIRDRVANPQTKDDHFVSEYIFDSYYNKNNSHYLFSSLKTDYGIDGTKVKGVNNNGQFEDILDKINEFIDLIIGQEGDSLVATSS
jgi:adenylate kinase family enzyme